MPKKTRIAAVIDIGSNELKLQIAQTAKPDGSSEIISARGIKYLESLRYPLGLGRDTFHTGRMSFEKADKACAIIRNFLAVARDYGVTNIKTIATTAVREAANMDYILDQIMIKTGLTVHVLDDMEEKQYIYKLLMHYVGEDLLRSAMMVYIGAGNIGLSVLADGRLPFLQNIKVGSLRMGELFEDIEPYTSEFYRLMEEYLASFTEQLTNEIPGGIRHFIVSGHEIGLIAELSGATGAAGTAGTSSEPVFSIPKERFDALYDDIKLKTADCVATDYGIDSDRADVLLPAACIYQNLLQFTQADRITASFILPCDAVLYEMLYPKAFAAFNKQFAKNTLLSAKALARRFGAMESHYAMVHDCALTIFDKMKKIHGLGSRDKLLLQTAAILHDTGKFINNRNHFQHSYEIVRGSDIVGFNQRETEIVALLCLYHSRVTPSPGEPRYAALDADTRVRVSKLAAILRMADALDRSHKQKFTRIAVKTTENTLTVTAVSDGNTALEQWSFNDKGHFFEEVFGIKAILRVKGNL